MERTLKIFMACAIGALVGTIVALELSHYFWWIGLIVGGLTGYLSYEFKEVVRMMPRAYRTVSSWKPKESTKIYWKRYGLCLTASLTIILSLLPLLLIITGDLTLIWRIPLAAGVFSGAISFLWAFDKDLLISDLKKGIKMFNAFSLYFYWLPKGILWSIRNIPKAIMFLGRFIKTFFILIHSDIRLLCGIDAAIGTAIGYFAGSAVVGFFAGGLIGVANYELVSKKLLKLQVKNS